MTPERWRQVDELFDSALRVEPDVREDWLRGACGDDEDLRREVARLLAADAQADRNGFLKLPEPPIPTSDRTRDWSPPPRVPDPPANLPEPWESVGAAQVGGAGGFTPKTVIWARTGPYPALEAQPLAQQRLREMTIIYLLIALMMIFWKYVVVRDPEPLQAAPYLAVIVLLGGIAARLSGPKPISSSMLKAMELGIIGIVALAFAVGQYYTMLDFTLRGQPMRAQLVMKNRVLITAVLILSYGIYVPLSWHHAAMVVGPLALLPFATLLTLYLRHPKTMDWLERMGLEEGNAPIVLFGFDVMILLILAAGSASGAHLISRLQRQIKEARQLGQYRLGRRLGAGGMGEVYLAEHQFLKRPCALKLIRSGVESSPKALERFEREVRLTATLSHPNIIEIYDYGRTEDGTYYYVMEYLPGLSLAELVEQHGPLPPARAVYLLRQVARALREAHSQGLIHRDIKPSNIFAAQRGGSTDVAKLLDFGLVRSAATVNAPHLSEEGRILGTPLFMSPEQAMGSRELDERSDIYSLGVVAYYLLTGRPPFDEGGGIAALIAHARDPVIPPSRLRPEIPEDLEAVVLRCLAKPPDDRFPNAESLEHALGECACAGDWDENRAGQWWQGVDHVLTPPRIAS